MHPYINTAIKAARRAGDIIMRAYARPDQVTIVPKGKNDVVTNVDLECEQVITDVLLSAYPDHGILGEENGESQKNDSYEWIIDPIDGTKNFANGFPHFCVSIALRHKNRIEHGVIYDPIRNDLFTASRGQGAAKNEYRIRVGQKTKLQEALIGFGLPPNPGDKLDSLFDALKVVTKKSFGMRRAGSAALDLAYVACGQLDGFWELNLKPWDIAAGILIVKEAGGLVSDVYGREDYFKNGSVVSGNPKIFRELLTLLKPFFNE
jgi:myo-inositol-1(or 4)-monophosphatase